jgi:hypothetical protein
MQTFVPSTDFAECARFLDRPRLGKQRVEVLQILNALTGKSAGWTNHPATLMWKKHESTLALYGIHMCDEWIRRGYKDTCREKISEFLNKEDNSMPSWWGGPIHSSHRAALLFKNPNWYSQFGWIETPIIQYVWPVFIAR